MIIPQFKIMFSLYKFDQLDSTQDYARENFALLQLPAIILAFSQTKGRGTKAREWISPAGGLYMTLVRKFDFGQDPLQSSLDLSYKLGKILSEFLSQYSSEIYQKPINDIYARQAKLGGILVEQVNQDFLLLGLGLNVLPVNIPNLRAISLQELGIEALDIEWLALEIAQEFNNKLI